MNFNFSMLHARGLLNLMQKINKFVYNFICLIVDNLQKEQSPIHLESFWLSNCSNPQEEVRLLRRHVDHRVQRCMPFTGGFIALKQSWLVPWWIHQMQRGRRNFKFWEVYFLWSFAFYFNMHSVGLKRLRRQWWK